MSKLNPPFYVRAGARGNANGGDWHNAFPELPASLVRGAEYYIAAGKYPAHTFDDAESGTVPIALVVANARNHGTPTGWNDSFAGPVTFAAPFTVLKNGYVFEGPFGIESISTNQKQ